MEGFLLSFVLVSFLLSFFLLICFFFFFFFLSGHKNTIKVHRHGSAAATALPPGPKGWPIVGNLLQLGRFPHKTLHAMSRTYGPFMHLRIGSTDVVVASSPRTAALLLKTHDANFATRHETSAAAIMFYDGHDIAFRPYGQRWRMLRNICSLHLFSPRAIDETHRGRAEEVAALVRSLLPPDYGGGVSETTTGLRIDSLLTECTGNNLSRVIMGKRLFGELGSTSEKAFKKLAMELMTLNGIFVVGDYLQAVRWMDLGGYDARMKKASRSCNQFLDIVMDEHRRILESGGQRKEPADMLTKLLELKEDADGKGSKLSDDDIKGVLLDMFVAGTDSSSATVEWAMGELIRHPDILKKAQDELDSVVGSERLVRESDLQSLPFLGAVIKETFRLHPAGPLAIPHKVIETCEVDGYLIPEGTVAFVNIWAIGRDPEVWEDPLEFRPERFLDGGRHADVDVAGKNFELIPFSSGRRMCVGMNLGILMVKMILASLVHAFHWELPAGESPGTVSMEEHYGMSINMAEPLVLCPKPRLQKHAY